jgi:hypothetical protein
MKTGSQLIKAIVEKLDEEQKQCLDSDIVLKIKELTYYELLDLINSK